MQHKNYLIAKESDMHKAIIISVFYHVKQLQDNFVIKINKSNSIFNNFDLIENEIKKSAINIRPVVSINPLMLQLQFHVGTKICSYLCKGHF